MTKRFTEEEIDRYYAESLPCPGCGSPWLKQVDDHWINSHDVNCALLAQFDEEDQDIDDEIAP